MKWISWTETRDYEKEFAEWDKVAEGGMGRAGEGRRRVRAERMKNEHTAWRQSLNQS